ncbi:MAG TPA: electron transfer flavoprotein subunit alpha/FixB family protein [Bryobacteraceae bacterium]|nr:electron transfer flavoprotein subunit alpha/FixB family protein [Bryobacteraceae bacterium]
MKILAVLEQQSGAWRRMSWETLAAAQEMAVAMGAEVEAAVAGWGIANLAAEAATKQASRVWAVEHALLKDYTADGYTAAFEALLGRIQPELTLLPHTYQTRDFAPKLATRFERVLISDAIAARVENGAPVFTRQLFQGKMTAEVRPRGAGPHFASLQAGAWRAEALKPGAARVETFEPPLQASEIRQKPEAPFRESGRVVDLSAASKIVSVGRGIGEKERIGIAEELARALGAELAASRPICDAGWLPMERQVGSSGQTVSPQLYVAVGISGAIQHLVGMKGSKTIVAINKDKDAPIFEAADYGIVGDLFEVVPALVEEIVKSRC